MKKWLRDQIIFPLVSKLPRNLRSRIKMAGTCLFGQGWGYLLLSIPTGDIHDVSADEIQKLYGELSNRSREVLLTYHKYAELAACFSKHLKMTENNVVIIPLKKLFPALEEKVKKEENICQEIRRKVCFDCVLPEVFCYHHGLKFLDPSVWNYIRNTVFLDLGAFIGDSAYILSRYNPSKILSFEPSACNGKMCMKNLQRERITNFELLPLGVSDQEGTMSLDENGLATSFAETGNRIIEVVSIDGFLKQREYGKIGLIKADLEGMGLKMVKGAMKTIKRDRPVLLLAIYHNRDEFMGIYQLLKENLQNYHYRIEPLSGFHEITLVAWPDEASKAE